MANTDPITTTQTDPSAALWRIVLSEYRQIEADYNKISAEHDEANAAYEREMGDPNPDFERYGLGRFGIIDDNRDKYIRNVETAIAIEDYRGQHITAEVYAEIARKAATLVDEASADRRRSDEVFERTIGSIDKQWEAQLGKLCEARGKLYDTPAPDAAAVVLKLSILAAEMKEADAEDAENVEAIRADAERLFGKVA
jgi:hypothetical protein